MKLISSVVSVLIVILFFFNIGNVFDYNDNITPVSSTINAEQTNDVVETKTDKYAGLKSIKDLPVSGNLAESSLSFTKPQIEAEEGKTLTEEDNKKIFFFGSADVESGDNNWNEWEENTSSVSPNTSETGVTQEPVEVSLDRFLQN